MIEISQAAAEEIARIQSARHKPDSKLRLKVEQGGCCGLFYCLDLESQRKQQDHCFESQGISIVVDPHSYLYLHGTKLDYAEDLMGGGFRFQNPNVANSCGCGISFSQKNSAQD